MTLLFNVLVTASPKELAGDVGSLRGTTNNLAAAVGTAVAGALLVGLLSAIILGVAEHPGTDAGSPVPDRPRQHHLRQQRPAADRAGAHQHRPSRSRRRCASTRSLGCAR